jgi:hypothetical protein
MVTQDKQRVMVTEDSGMRWAKRTARVGNETHTKMSLARRHSHRRQANTANEGTGRIGSRQRTTVGSCERSDKLQGSVKPSWPAWITRLLPWKQNLSHSCSSGYLTVNNLLYKHWGPDLIDGDHVPHDVIGATVHKLRSLLTVELNERLLKIKECEGRVDQSLALRGSRL